MMRFVTNLFTFDSKKLEWVDVACEIFNSFPNFKQSKNDSKDYRNEIEAMSSTLLECITKTLKDAATQCSKNVSLSFRFMPFLSDGDFSKVKSHVNTRH